MIASGDIKVKQGVEPIAFTETGLRFSDGSEMAADAVIFAYVLTPPGVETLLTLTVVNVSTGYVNIRDVNRKIFGADIIDKTDNVWGLKIGRAHV